MSEARLLAAFAVFTAFAILSVGEPDAIDAIIKLLGGVK
jgi:hypothetical protein